MTRTESNLRKATEEFYMGSYRTYTNYSLGGKFLASVIEEYLKNDSYVKDYNISSNTLFDSPGYECGYIAVAWIENDNSLHTIVYEWEV